MTKKVQRGLGRGLDALLGDISEERAANDVDAVRMLSIHAIDPNREQPRRSFDETALDELAGSIRAVGVLQPIIVAPQGDRYTIIAGERRYRAARIAGLEEIPAIVRDWDAQKQLEAALIENLQRDDLNPIEEAEGIRRLMQEAGLTQEAVSQRLGKSRPAVANLLRLLSLPDAVRKLLIEGSLSAGHARALIGLSAQRQVQLANLAVQQGWSVRQMEKVCAETEEKPKRSAKARRDQQLTQLEGMARELFGTRVRLDGTTEGGRMTLYYYNADDLQRIWDVLAAAGARDEP